MTSLEDQRTMENSNQPIVSTPMVLQGESTGRMRLVLTLSLVLTVLALGTLVFWWAGSHQI